VSLETQQSAPKASGRRERRALPRRIGLNAVFLVPGMGGIDTYVQELVPELMRLAPDSRFTVYCTPVGERHLGRLDWANEARFVTHPLLGRRGLRAASELTLLGALAGHDVDLLHSVALTAPLRTRAVNVVTIHDATWMRGAPTDPSTRLWRMIVPTVARRADRVIAVSQAAATDVEELLRVPRERIDVTLEGYTPQAAVAPIAERTLRDRYSIRSGPIVLMVGTRKPHKNLLRLIAAIPEVLETSPKATLALCGNATAHEDELRAEVARLGLTESVRFLPFVDAAELEGLYRAASCVVLASTNEGFGLPVLEAMGRGVPVACSNASALPEVAGDGARYFDPYDVGQIAGAIGDVLTDRRLAKRLIAAGRAQAAALTWERTAEGTLDCYERAWRGRG
jgi:glycosyltransferase involved in cell wall biosynthesis